MKGGSIEFFAGPRALEAVREKGLAPEMVHVIAGAAGGPKWLALHGLDRAIFFRWLGGLGHPVHLVGSSIGVWRFAALSQKNPESAYETFREEYIRQRYERKPTPEEVTRESLRILDSYLPDARGAGILESPAFRLTILTVRSRGICAREGLPLALGLASAATANLVSRRGMSLFFRRAAFRDRRAESPLPAVREFRRDEVMLDYGNLREAVLASGSIPLVMSRVTEIAGAPAGSYRDGGLLDYHLDLPYRVPDGGIVLYPHYADRIIPGWFDKKIVWRGPRRDHMRDVLLVCPSRRFIEALPMKKIPDRDDFFRFFRRDDERIAYWKEVVVASTRLGDEFTEAVASGRIREMVRLL
ncbi:MAG: patatin-like phospholipase family protein [Spirochaetes bacterium]|nr:patatin-like phospholipase family protein [Spirochaetota bacterium]